MFTLVPKWVVFFLNRCPLLQIGWLGHFDWLLRHRKVRGWKKNETSRDELTGLPLT